MLQLTHDAAAELDAARRAQRLPETCGVRLFGERASGDELAIGITFAEYFLRVLGIAFSDHLR